MALIDKIKQDLNAFGYDAKNRQSTDWLMRKVKSVSSGATSGTILRDRNRKVAQPSIGRMFFFSYDPKTKDKLPFYDRFPLVLPIEEYDDGFLGLNLHYLSFRDRAALLSMLYSYTNNNKWDNTTKIRASYDLIARASKLAIARPCIKRYLFSHVRSKFIEIAADEWEIAIFLPVERFVGASSSKVHKISRGSI